MFTATVTGVGETPTGTVAFYDGNPTAGGTELGTPVPLTAGSPPVRFHSMPRAPRTASMPSISPRDRFHLRRQHDDDARLGLGHSGHAHRLEHHGKLQAVRRATTTATLNTSAAVLSGVLNGDTVSVSPSGYTANFVIPDVFTGHPRNRDQSVPDGPRRRQLCPHPADRPVR